MNTNYSGPRVDGPILTEWSHLVELPLYSAIEADGEIFLKVNSTIESEPKFSLLMEGGECLDPVYLSGDKLKALFIDRLIKVLRIA